MTSHCDVTIGGNPYCSQCSKPDEYLIDGACTAQVGTSGCKLKDPPDGTCTQCGDGYFLHKGGCYKKGQQPGQTICKDTADIKGKCQACASGYFNNPAATDNAKESCIACGDVTGVDSNKGVQHCATCTVEGAETTGKTAKCTACADGYFISGDGSACTVCSDQTNGVTDCTACVPRTDDPAKAKCTACSGSKKPSLDGTSCNTCSDSNCAFCNSQQVCEGCTSGYILDGDACTQQTCSTPTARHVITRRQPARFAQRASLITTSPPPASASISATSSGATMPITTSASRAAPSAPRAPQRGPTSA